MICNNKRRLHSQAPRFQVSNEYGLALLLDGFGLNLLGGPF